jgi:hypothetical protein
VGFLIAILEASEFADDSANFWCIGLAFAGRQQLDLYDSTTHIHVTMGFWVI